MPTNYPWISIKLILLYLDPRENEICPNIHICRANIVEVESAKFVGIITDNWVEHARCISRKIAKGIGVLLLLLSLVVVVVVVVVLV